MTSASSPQQLPACCSLTCSGVQVRAGFSEIRAVRRNNVNLLKLFLGRWLYATPLDVEALLNHLAAPMEERGGSDRRQFGMQLLVLGATPPQRSCIRSLCAMLRSSCRSCCNMKRHEALRVRVAMNLTQTTRHSSKKVRSC